MDLFKVPPQLWSKVQEYRTERYVTIVGEEGTGKTCLGQLMLARFLDDIWALSPTDYYGFPEGQKAQILYFTRGSRQLAESSLRELLFLVKQLTPFKAEYYKSSLNLDDKFEVLLETDAKNINGLNLIGALVESNDFEIVNQIYDRVRSRVFSGSYKFIHVLNPLGRTICL